MPLPRSLVVPVLGHEHLRPVVTLPGLAQSEGELFDDRPLVETADRVEQRCARSGPYVPREGYFRAVAVCSTIVVGLVSVDVMKSRGAYIRR